MSSVYFFLVAEASAISSAPKTMSRGTFFSRARTSTSITSSRFPAATAFTATLASQICLLQIRYQLRPVQVVEREPDDASLQLDLHPPSLGPAQHAGEPAPAGCIRSAHPDLGPVPGEARKVGLLAQRPVEPGRRDFQPFVVDPFDRQDPRYLVADSGAIVERDPPGLVDEEA